MINKECDESSLQQFQTVYSVVSRDGLAQVRCLSWMNTALGMGWEGATDICVTSVTCWRGRTRDTWSTRRCSTTASRFVHPTFMATGTTYHIFTLYVNINHTTVWTSNALIHSVGRDTDPGSKEADHIISPFLHFDLIKRFFLPWMFFIILSNFVVSLFSIIIILFTSQTSAVFFQPLRLPFIQVFLLSKSHCVAHFITCSW